MEGERCEVFAVCVCDVCFVAVEFSDARHIGFSLIGTKTREFSTVKSLNKRTVIAWVHEDGAVHLAGFLIRCEDGAQVDQVVAVEISGSNY